MCAWAGKIPPTALAGSLNMERIMKKVIDGKTYNTETATMIAGDNSPYGVTDFAWEDTALYKTAKGAFFIAGEGNAASRWSTSLGNGGRGPGKGIETLTPAEALAWCEANDVDADIIAKHFTVEEA